MLSKMLQFFSCTGKDKNTRRVVITMTAMAWIALITGVAMCATNIREFSDRNLGLMVGIGFLVGSVFIYVIAKAVGLVNARGVDEDAIEK